LPPPGTELDVDAAAASTVVAGPRAFREWLKSKSLKELNELTKSAAAFQQAEAGWRREEFKTDCQPGRRRKRVDTKVNLKYATSVAYEKWRSGPGKDSRSHLKDPSSVRVFGFTMPLPILVLPP
jgi:hypothetical protein